MDNWVSCNLGICVFRACCYVEEDNVVFFYCFLDLVVWLWKRLLFFSLGFRIMSIDCG